MRIFFLILLLLPITIIGFQQDAFAYHGERERIEISQMTGLFNSQMERIMSPLAGQQYHLQVVLRDEAQYENVTVSVGYGFNFLERTPNKLSVDSKPFLRFNTTHSTSAGHDSKTIQTSQYKFPIIVNFTVAFENPGVYRFSYFEHVIEPRGGSGSSCGGYHVVSEYSKAVNENGDCKNPKLITLSKHDFSKLVCVTGETHHSLITRGWGPLPG